ncbi:MAG: hypothetical protein MJ078_01235 [Clostridia bacterium]|nr:hypothetical protein [Clostridia bacterium]
MEKNMRVQNDIRSAKRDAGVFLFRFPLKLPIFGFCLLLWIAWGGVGLIADAAFGELTAIPSFTVRGNPVPWFSCAVSLLFGALVVCPLLICLDMALCRAVNCDTPCDISLFKGFWNKEAGRYAFRRSANVFLTVLAVESAFLGAVYAGKAVADRLYENGDPARCALVWALTLCFCLFLFWIYRLSAEDRFLMNRLFADESREYRKIKSASKSIMGKERKALRKFNRSFIPLLLFSVLLFGLPLFFTLPYYAVSKACFTKKLCVH